MKVLRVKTVGFHLLFGLEVQKDCNGVSLKKDCAAYYQRGRKKHLDRLTSQG
jgi:hypothetical protein